LKAAKSEAGKVLLALKAEYKARLKLVKTGSPQQTLKQLPRKQHHLLQSKQP